MGATARQGLVEIESTKYIHKAAKVATITSLSVILAALEQIALPSLPVPGVKFGLANLPLLFTFPLLGIIEIFLITFLRIVISALLFSGLNPLTVSLSFAGGFSAVAVLVFLKASSLLPVAPGENFSWNKMSYAGVGVLMSIAHVFAQFLIASIILNTSVFFIFLPLAGSLSAILGLAGGMMANYLVPKLTRYF